MCILCCFLSSQHAGVRGHAPRRALPRLLHPSLHVGRSLRDRPLRETALLPGFFPWVPVLLLLWYWRWWWRYFHCVHDVGGGDTNPSQLRLCACCLAYLAGLARGVVASRAAGREPAGGVAFGERRVHSGCAASRQSQKPLAAQFISISPYKNQNRVLFYLRKVGAQ